MTQEQAQAGAEQDELTEQLGETSAAESETSEKPKAEVNESETEAKGKETEEPKKPFEESFEEKLERMADSKAQKSLKGYNQKIDQLTKENSQLKSQVSDKMWNTHLQNLFKADVDELGDEDKAKQNDAARKLVAEQVKDYHLNKERVEAGLKDIAEKVPKLGIIERNQKAREDMWTLLFPEDKEKFAKYQAHLKKFEKAQDMEDYEIILEGIKESIKAGPGKEPHVPDSSRGGGGSPDMRNKSPDEKIAYGLAQAKKKQKT